MWGQIMRDIGRASEVISTDEDAQKLTANVAPSVVSLAINATGNPTIAATGKAITANLIQSYPEKATEVASVLAMGVAIPVVCIVSTPILAGVLIYEGIKWLWDEM